MWRNYFKIAFRSLWKSKSFVFINVLGMGVAIACCIVAYLNFEYNQKFDVEHVNADQLYRINSERNFQGRIKKLGLIPRPMGELLRTNIDDIERLTHYRPWGGNVRIKDDLFTADISYVDPEFFEMFSFQVLKGIFNLEDRSTIYINDALAEKFFGDEDPLGQTITQVLDSGVRDYTVAGVFRKKPSNSSFMFVEAYTHYENFYRNYPKNERGDWKSWNATYIQVSDPDRISTIERQFADYLEPQNKAKQDFQVTRYYLDPLPGMAVREEAEDIDSYTREGLPGAAVVGPLVMAVLILLLACFNFTNTSIAMSGRRLKEIGLRKVMGGLKTQLVIQFLLENILLCFMAMVFGLLIAEFLVPVYSQMWDFIDLELQYIENYNLLLFLFGLLLTTGILAGSYPAFYITKFQPASILKGTHKFGGTSPLTRSLLALQLTIALLAVISSFAFIQNAQFQKDFDLGYEGDAIIHVGFNNYDDYEIYKNAVVGDPQVLDYSGSKHQLMESLRNDPIKHESVEHEVDILNVDENYLQTMNMRLQQGRNFKPESETDRMESVIISEEVANLFGWTEPLGKQLIWMDTVQLYVIGVVDNIYTNALWEPLEPVMFRYAKKEDYRFLTVRSNPSEVVETNQYLESKWKEIFPYKLYTGEYINVEISQAADVNNNIVKMFSFLGVVAMMLAISGLFTLVSLNLIKRIKEIAIRKVMGASIGSIATKMNQPFFIVMVIAFVLGSAASYLLVGSLMDSIWAYHMDMNVTVFLLSGLAMLIVSVLTVGFKVFNTASMNPVNALRDE